MRRARWREETKRMSPDTSPDTCASCGATGALTDVEVGDKTWKACSEACAQDLRAGKPRAYSTMAIDTDVLRKALLRRRK
jgi:hypothetical protein